MIPVILFLIGISYFGYFESLSTELAFRRRGLQSRIVYIGQYSDQLDVYVSSSSTDRLILIGVLIFASGWIFHLLIVTDPYPRAHQLMWSEPADPEPPNEWMNKWPDMRWNGSTGSPVSGSEFLWRSTHQRTIVRFVYAGLGALCSSVSHCG